LACGEELAVRHHAELPLLQVERVIELLVLCRLKREDPDVHAVVGINVT